MLNHYPTFRKTFRWYFCLLLLMSLTAYGQNPLHSYSKQLGGNAPQNLAQAVAIDASGNAYVAGLFSGTTNVGGSDLVAAPGNGPYTMYIAKYSASGGHLWSKAFGQMAPLAVFPLPSLAVDNNNNLIVTGSFSGTTNMGGNTLTSAGSYDMFMAMYSGTNGNHIWSKAFGGSGNDSGVKLTVAGSNSLVVCGTFSGTVNLGTGNMVATGGTGSFVAMFDNAGNNLWARSVTGPGDTYLASVAYGQNGIIVSGFFTGSAVNAGAVAVTSANGDNIPGDLLLATYDVSGNLLWAKSFGGPDREFGSDVVRDADGAIIVCGFSTGTADLGGGDLSAEGVNNAFIAKYTPAGIYQWGRVYAAGSDNVYDQHIAMNGRNQIALSRSFATGSGAPRTLTINGLQPDGTPQWAVTTGNNSGYCSAAQLVLKNDYFVATGPLSGSVSFDGSTTLTTSGNQVSSFLIKYNLCTTGIASQPATASMACNGNNITTAVSVTGIGGPFVYQWYKDGVSLGPAQSTSALSLSNVQVTDSGNYSVVVTSSCVTLTSTAFALRVVTAAPARLYVDAGAAGANTGLSWEDAFTDLQLALRYPCRNNLTEIWIAGGIYKPTSATADRGATFLMLPDVAVYGGFEGWETLLSQRPAINYTHPSSTTLSGDIDGDGTGANNTNFIVTNRDLSRTAILDGVTITSPGSTCVCSGITNVVTGAGKQCSPVIRNCFFTDLNTTWPGSYISNLAGSGGDVIPEIYNCWFMNAGTSSFGLITNYATNGGIAKPVLVNALFAGNQTELIDAIGLGGLITSYVFSGTVNMECINCTFSHAKKGVITNYNYNNSGSIQVKLTNSVIWNNSVTPFFNYSASPNATIQINNSLIDGAATEYTGTDNLTITGSPFVTATDFNLSPGSAGVNGGNPVSVTVANGPYSVSALPGTDLVGNPRITGGRIDMGAFEYQPTNTLITAQPAAGSVVCPGGQVAVSVSATSLSGGALSFQWYKGGTAVSGQSTSALSLSNVQAADAGSYSVVVSDGVTSETSSAFSLTVGTVPVATLLSNGPLSCTQTSVTLTAGGGTSWTFTGSSGVIGTPGSNTALVSSAGTYTVTVANAAGCRSATTTTVSSNTTTPVVSISASSLSVTCANPAVSLTASGSGSVRWSTGETTAVISVSAANTYSVTLTGGNGCTAVNSLSIGSNTGNPNVNLTPLSATLTCASPAVTLTATAGLTSYAFSTGQNGPANSLSVSSAGIYSVVVTGANGCTASAMATIYSSTALPSVTLAASGAVSCTATSVTLTASPANLTYSFGNGAVQIGNTNQAVVNAAGPYAVTVTNADGCKATGQVTVTGSTTVPMGAILTASAGGTLTCGQTALTLTASATGLGLSYAFGGSGVVAQSGSSATVNAAGTYSVVITGNNSCTATAVTTVSSNTTTPVVSVSASSLSVTCANPAVSLMAAGGGSVRWSTGETTAVISVTVANTYSVTLTGGNTCTAINSLSIGSNTGAPSLSVTPSSVTLTCASPSAVLSVIGSGSARWSTGAVSNTISVASAGTYSVTLTGANGCTSVRSATVVSATVVPSLTLSPSSAAISCASPTVSLSAIGNGSVRWSTGATGPVISVTAAGTYSVTLTDGGSCTAAASAVVSGSLLGNALVNADGPIGCGVTTTTVRVQSSGATSFTLLGPNGYNQTNNTGAFSVSAGGSYTGIAGQSGCVVSNTVVVVEGGVQPTISSVQATGSLGNGACRVSVQGAGYGDRYVLTSPSGYVFSVVYRTVGYHTAVFPDVVKPGTYTLTVYSGNCVVTQTVAVTGTACP